MRSRKVKFRITLDLGYLTLLTLAVDGLEGSVGDG